MTRKAERQCNPTGPAAHGDAYNEARKELIAAVHGEYGQKT